MSHVLIGGIMKPYRPEGLSNKVMQHDTFTLKPPVPLYHPLLSNTELAFLGYLRGGLERARILVFDAGAFRLHVQTHPGGDHFLHPLLGVRHQLHGLQAADGVSATTW